jgi:ATP-dependent Lhr-like helicase
VDGLRRMRHTERIGEVVKVRPADPLNLVGILTPGPRVAPHVADGIVFRDGAREPSEPLAAQA